MKILARISKSNNDSHKILYILTIHKCEKCLNEAMQWTLKFQSIKFHFQVRKSLDPDNLSKICQLQNCLT